MPQNLGSKPTLDQRRAKHAWNAIKSLKPEEQQEYAREARKLPIRIMTAGLGQALAFIFAKAKNKKRSFEKLLEHLTEWVINECQIPAKKQNSLIESIIEGDPDFLRRATDEVLAYLVWLNRFAEAEGLTGEVDKEG